MAKESKEELELYLENDEPLYRRRQAIETNLVKKVCKGVFETDKAAIAFTRLASEAASSYKNELDRTASFSMPDRRALGRELAQDFKANVQACRRGEAARCNNLSEGAQAALKASTCSTAELRGARRRRR